MTPRRRAALFAGLLLYAAVAVGSLLPAGDIPTPLFDGMDKLEHLAGYAVLSAYGALVFPSRRGRLGAMLVAVAFGVAIEFAQGMFTTTREADALDVLANTVGAVVGQLLALAPAARRLRRRA